MPQTSREFQRAADQRLTTAQFLLRHKYNLDAMYLAGYAIECSLKALIIQVTAPPDLSDTIAKITSGSRMHRAEVLIGELRDRGVVLPPQLAKRLRKFDLEYGLAI